MSTIRIYAVWLSSIYFLISSNSPQFLPLSSHRVFQRWDGNKYRGGIALHIWAIWWMNICCTDGHMMQSEPLSNKAATKRVFCWKCSIQAHGSFTGIKVIMRWRWSDCLVLQKERIHEKIQQRRPRKWRETKWIQGPYSVPLHRVLLKLPVHRSWLTLFCDGSQLAGSKFYNTYNQKRHHLLKFLFWPFPWTVDDLILSFL